MADADLQIDDRAPIATIAFARPAARNALTLAMLQSVAGALTAFASRSDLRVVVLRGAADQPFSAGYNLEQLPDGTLTADDARAVHAPVRAAARAMLACPHPVIGAARQFVYGAALDLFCHCDLRICASGTTFSMPPNRFGFLYPAEGVYRLADVAGLSRASEMLLLGSPITDRAALACGLVQKVVNAATFEDELSAMCRMVAENAPLSVRHTKGLLVGYCDGPLARDRMIDQTYVRIAECLNSADVAEGRAAFREKRAPRFEGR